MPTPITTPTRNAFSLRHCALLLALVAAILLPGFAHATPVAQQIEAEDLAGVWESTRSNNGDTVRLAFFEDHTVQGTSLNDNDDSTMAFHGTWEALAEGGFTIFFTRVDGLPNDDTIAMPGVLELRTLRLPEAAEWGADGMTLTRIEDEPRAIADELLADKAPPIRGHELVGVYRSVLLGDPVGDGNSGYITLTLADDYTAEVVSETTGTEADVVETGTWLPVDDESIRLWLLTSNGVPYNPMVIITFLVDGDELLAPEITDFGEEGLLLTRVREARPSIAGLYATLPFTTTPGLVHLTLYLAEDGSLQSSGIVLAGDDAPVLARGVWTLEEDGSILLTSHARLTLGDDDRMVSEETEPTTETMIREGNTLISGELTFYRVGPADAEREAVGSDLEDDILADSETVDEAEADDDVIGIEEEVINGDAGESADENADEGEESKPAIFVSAPDQIVAGNAVILTLTEAGAVTLTVTSRALDAPVSDSGTWERDGIKFALRLTLTTDQNGEALDEPQIIVYQIEPDDSLTSDDYDTERYGPNINVRLRR